MPTSKLYLGILVLANVAFLTFIGPALISAPNWLSVIGGFTIIGVLIYLDTKAYLSFRALVAETTSTTKE